MVMGLVLEEYEPLLRLLVIAIVHLNGYDYGAGVNLVGLLHVGKLAVLLQLSHSHQCKIHQADKLVRSACKNLSSGIQIALIGGL